MADQYLRVEVLSRTPRPQTLVWSAMHQDYYEGYVGDDEPPSEPRAGEICVKRLLAGERGHFGPLEHPSITFGVAGFPHSVMQQARTHRVGVSFDVQSMRYTGQRMVRVVSGEVPVEAAIYFREPGYYRDRDGKKYRYSVDDLTRDKVAAMESLRQYAIRLKAGFAEEHIRGMLPFDFRQNFVVSFNLRSALHFLDLRAKADAQPEIQTLCDLMLPHLEDWAPQILGYYIDKRLGKARLAP